MCKTHLKDVGTPCEGVFFLVFARDETYVAEKICELESLGFPYLVVCGKNLSYPNVVFRECRGKYDAINFGFEFVPKETEIVVLNDVDTKIKHFEDALRCFISDDADMVFAKVSAVEGPQQVFLPILRRLRKIVPVAASGDLMLVRYGALKKALPIKPCKAEDSYLLFRLLAQKGKAVDCEECYVIVEKTRTTREEALYKERTVSGIYQALALADPPLRIKIFYIVLPFISPILLVTGKKGYSWAKGILMGLTQYLRGDTSGYWQPVGVETPCQPVVA